MSAALVLVDFQQDFLNAPGLEPSADAVVAAGADLLARCRRRGVEVFHVRTTVSREDDRRMPHWKRAGRWICVAGTPGHAAPAALAPAAGERVFDKTGYSAFLAEGFADALGAAPRTLVLAGVHLHACVRQTAVDAYQRGFDVIVADDAVAGDDPVHAAATRRWLGARGARFAPVASIPALLDGAAPADAGRAPVDAAAAHAAGPAWRATAGAERAALLERLAALVEADAADLARAMATGLGKPVRYGAAEAAWAAALVRSAARLAVRDLDRPCGPNVRARRRPHGVVAVVTPWNNPVGIPLGKIAPAIALGNTVAWKPAPAAAPIAARVADLLARAGAPDGLVQLVPGDADTACALMEDERVRAISLTGSAAAGRAAQEIAARRHVPLQAELGGNNAAIVWSDAEDLARAAAEIAAAGFAQAGQRCTANRRVVVDARCAGAFVDLLVRATAALVVGDPLDPATQVGPLVSAAARDRVAAALARARPAARAVHVPHGAAPPHGAFLSPAIVECDDARHPIVTDELFGPVVVVQRADGFDHALALANGPRQGLVAALFSASAARRARFLAEAEAGLLKLDQATAGAAVAAPFGGWKASGAGPAEHGEADVEFYTRAQAVYD